MRSKILFIPLMIALFLTGCADDKKTVTEKTKADAPSEVEKSNNEEQTKENDNKDTSANENEELITGEALPETLAQLANRLPGKTEFLNYMVEEERKEIDKLIANLPTLSASASEEEMDRYYEALLSVFQQDFVGPQDLIDRLKFQSMGSPDVEDPRMQFKENLNVMIILDASGSMGNYVGGQTQMQAAKSAISSFVKGLPKGANVGLRVYGHEGTGSASDKVMSCSSSEIIYPLGVYDGNGFDAVLKEIEPAGWTPTQLALNEAEKDLAAYKGDKNTNIVYLVGDGISTCDDDPVAAAKQLYDSDITPIVNVIGFNVDNEGQKQLKAVAEATNGSYQDVQNAEGLQEELDQATKVAQKWEQWKTSSEGWLDYDKVNNSLDIFGYHAEEYRKLTEERQQIGFVLTYLVQEKKTVPEDSFAYLEEKNQSYHKWIEEEFDKLKMDLETLNEKKYNEAIQSLEDKYKENMTKP